MTGAVAFVLHAHLPYVRHPERDDPMEERWLFEALTDTYLPLLFMIERLKHRRIDARLTLSISPTLMAMLDDEYLRERYVRFMERLLDLGDRETARTNGTPDRPLAQRHVRHLRRCLSAYEKAFQRDVVSAFADAAKAGLLELGTTAATHGLLPLLAAEPLAVHAQIRAGLQAFEDRLGFKPSFFWLPECGYSQAVGRIAAAEGVQSVVLETTGLQRARPPQQNPFEPVHTPAGLLAFGRDAAASAQVWSAEIGYPSDPEYREYHRDIGWALPLGLIRPFLPEGHGRAPLGFKYNRITDRTSGDKAVYRPYRAARTACRHAAHFVGERRAAFLQTAQAVVTPVCVAPFDAELFGHWWHEGPLWLERTCRLLDVDPDLRTVTMSEAADLHTHAPESEPEDSTWGAHGDLSVWMNADTAAHAAETRAACRHLAAVSNLCAHRPCDTRTRRALQQAARELLLAQSSDWAFMVHAGRAVDYAEQRRSSHLRRLRRLTAMIAGEQPFDDRRLEALETADACFPNIDAFLFCPER